MNIFSKQPIVPAFTENNNLIVLAADNNYAPYLGVCIESIAENCIPSLNYDIVVLETNIHEYYKKSMNKMLDKFHNISLRFYNLKLFDEYMENLNKKTNAYFTAATYYRLYAPEIFYQYDRMLYLDCDMAVVGDFSELLNIDFDDKLLIAVPDITVQGIAYSPLDKVVWRCDDYLYDTLDVKDFSKYFQAGMLVFNLKKLREANFTEKALKKLNEMDRPRWVDQDILNSVLYKKVKYIDLKYNYTYHLEFSENRYQIDAIKKHVTSVYNQIKKLKNNSPVIIHYTSSKKPWKYPSLKYANLWWRYACMTPFYGEIISKDLFSLLNIEIVRKNLGNKDIFSNLQTDTSSLPIIKDVLNYKNNYIKYLKYKFLTKLSWGKKHDKYKQKKNIYKNKIKNARNFLKEN